MENTTKRRKGPMITEDLFRRIKSLINVFEYQRMEYKTEKSFLVAGTDFVNEQIAPLVISDTTFKRIWKSATFDVYKELTKFHNPKHYKASEIESALKTTADSVNIQTEIELPISEDTLPAVNQADELRALFKEYFFEHDGLYGDKTIIMQITCLLKALNNFKKVFNEKVFVVPQDLTDAVMNISDELPRVTDAVETIAEDLPKILESQLSTEKAVLSLVAEWRGENKEEKTNDPE